MLFTCWPAPPLDNLVRQSNLQTTRLWWNKLIPKLKLFWLNSSNIYGDTSSGFALAEHVAISSTASIHRSPDKRCSPSLAKTCDHATLEDKNLVVMVTIHQPKAKTWGRAFPSLYLAHLFVVNTLAEDLKGCNEIPAEHKKLGVNHNHGVVIQRGHHAPSPCLAE